MQLGGRHSKACLNCRNRRIKCDLKRPACSQCLRTRMQCSGYRDQQELMFRDESKKVEQRMQGTNHLPIATTDPQLVQSSSGSGSGSGSLSGPVSATPIGQSIAPPSLDRGIEFFYDTYISFISSTPPGRAALPASPAWNFLFKNPAYSNACSAAGYAGLSNVTGDSSHMITARKQYTLSLQSIERTIQEKSNLAMSFESAIILTVFEIVIGGSWGIHIQGGVAIWEMMTVQNQAPSPRTQLFWVFLIFIKCLLSEQPSPSSIGVWSQQLQGRMTSDDGQAAPLAFITSRFVDLYASIKAGETIDPEVIVRHAAGLEVELDAWEKLLPPIWQFTEKPSDNPSYAFQNQTHRYQDFWVARMLNNYRWIRILVNNLILFHLPEGSDRSPCLSTVARLSTEICHSVSYYLETFIIEEGQAVPFPVLAGCFLVMFPLAVAGCAVGVENEMHDWIVGKLEMIGVRMGIGGALHVIAEVKRLKKDWAVYAT